MKRFVLWPALMLAFGLVSQVLADEIVVGEHDALSLARLSVGAGGNYRWFVAQGGVAEPKFKKEWTVGLYSAYNLTRGANGIGRTSAIGAVEIGTDTKLLEYKIGVRVTLFSGGAR